ncbi:MULTISPECIES: HlyD family secretion protein [Pseudoalteromonas]|uniref:HlyD family efflux transporter periplasmic adaptor subunit n=1 Tax=Pseudoalteromonas haloplanktis TaxID=228 RepID=A0ABU1BIN6_PSEHA|nr:MULTISPECIES: HlyD family efflux transporter periplasmic adaptor subunit [Pseudoalteromonas]MCF6145291.1 HlyD family secretion protein [Pseudoalteromonas mariniglutinosa NCIMB 1770]MDQ9093462.1 HlyD family efflux transporter periplasmic adaptor subunit [Pseudoalteromonas haloplanktis]BDF94823.1 membrane protein [Pseudoalteromonas sp. KAN5]
MLLHRLLLLLISLLFLSACNDQDSNIALGTLERERVIHPATSSEVLIALPVISGQVVKQGQVIAQFDSVLQQALVDKADAQRQQAQANLDKVLNGARVEEVAAANAKVAAAKAALTQSEANFQRAKLLVKDKLASQETLDRAIANKDENSANLESAQQQLNELANGARIEDIQIAKAQLQASIAELKAQQKQLDDLTITATRDGYLDNLPWNIGERVTKGSPVAIVLASGAPYARVYIPEPYRVKLKKGMALSVTVDGLNQQFTGELTWISSEPAFTPYYALNQEERARLMYLAEVQLDKSAVELASGVPAQVILP